MRRINSHDDEKVQNGWCVKTRSCGTLPDVTQHFMHFQALRLFDIQTTVGAPASRAPCVHSLDTSGRYVGLHQTRTSAQRADAFLDDNGGCGSAGSKSTDGPDLDVGTASRFRQRPLWRAFIELRSARECGLSQLGGSGRWSGGGTVN